MLDKPIVVPEFETIFLNDTDNFYVVGIKNSTRQQETEILEVILGNELNRHIRLDNGTLTLVTNENVYTFDLSLHLQDFLNRLTTTEFFIAFSFLDENLQPKNNELRGISFQINKAS